MSLGKRIPLLTLFFLILFIPISAAVAQVHPSAEFDPHKIIVKFKQDSRMLARNASGTQIARLERLTPIKLDAGTRINPLPGGVERIFVAQLAEGANLEEVLRDLAANPEVEYAERDYIGQADGSGPLARAGTSPAMTVPNDPDFYWQWGLQNKGQLSPPGKPGIDVDAPAAWDITTGDSNIILAFLDTGIALNAPDFADRIIPGYNFINESTLPADDRGHGTAVASIAAATGGDGNTIAGMNWKCRILPVKILDSTGHGSYSAFAQGIIFAVGQRARVINISAGGTEPSQALSDAVAYAQMNGVNIVASMGNTNVEAPEYPAAIPGVIAVGAINNRGERAAPFFGSSTSGSNYGNHIAFVAPGDSIMALDFPAFGEADWFYGTSAAAPFVSGLISLMLAVNPGLSCQQVYDALKVGARDQIGPANEDGPGWDKYFGWGLIDAYQSLLAVPGADNTFFAQAAVGGGYATTFTFTNTGAEATSGILILTGEDGKPLSAGLSSTGYMDTVASSFPIRIPPGGTQSITASAVNQGDPAGTGWARVLSSGGSLQGVATFRQMNGSELKTVVGVLSADATSSAMIPIDDDHTLGTQSRATGYAVANPGNEAIYIRLALINTDGSPASRTIDPPALNPLLPGCHVARFLWEDLGDQNLQFKGTMVLTAQGAKTFSVVALVLNQGLYTAIPVIPAAQSGPAATTNFFAQVAIGGGYSTIYTLLNTGSQAVSGSLILTADDGKPLNALFISPGNPDQVASSFLVSIRPGGTQLVTAGALSPGDPARAGWARVESSGGSVQGVATFQLRNENVLGTIVGVLSAAATKAATIPVDDDRTLGAQSRLTGYAVANPGKEDINIKLVLVNPDGSFSREVYPPGLNPLRPGSHVPRFLWEDLNDPNLRFKGSMVLIERAAKTFSVVALMQNQGLYTAIPVIPAKAPGIQ